MSSRGTNGAATSFHVTPTTRLKFHPQCLPPDSPSTTSMSFRTTLRPVVWSHIDAHGKNRRRDRSPEDEHSSGDQGPPDSPPKKKKKEKAIGVPALYYPPTLSPSEKLWRDRSRFLFQRGYQLRPRYDPDWTPTIRGNGRHYHSGEDHIMQIVRLEIFFPPIYFINWSISAIPAPASTGRDTPA